MQKPQDDVAMDFGPNLFVGECDAATTPSANFVDTTNQALSNVTNVTHQLTECCSEGMVNETDLDQVSEISVPTISDVAPGVSTEQTSTQTRGGRSEVGTEALSSLKVAVKIFESINGFDKKSANQRTVVRDLILKQSEVMELKLQGTKPPEGEDFDVIAKQLRRENNRLDTLLEGKESLFGKARNAVETAIEKMQNVITEINRLEEEG